MYRIICLFLKTFLALSLFGGGLYILSLRLPFWSLLIGLIAVQLGIFLIIVMFDDISRSTIDQKMKEMQNSYNEFLLKKSLESKGKV